MRLADWSVVFRAAIGEAINNMFAWDADDAF
jgi:hypothetical protein